MCGGQAGILPQRLVDKYDGAGRVAGQKARHALIVGIDGGCEREAFFARPRNAHHTRTNETRTPQADKHILIWFIKLIASIGGSCPLGSNSLDTATCMPWQRHIETALDQPHGGYARADQQDEPHA